MPKIPESLTLDKILEALEADAYLGFCLACGAEHDEIEPDACAYPCFDCGAHRVYGAEELILMIA